ncbi:hypothetical protein CTAYLR_008743 [Chrysophaeum taylorii]|uniref:2Fe-2S ferredoxin-type domain-containing protein n=1 Tax=Chrysophaeum taylorii TaxID=2483200 RepID=A0AAD7XQ42_9STRA|nr:hypothetical protein CTAYLR_008743 [Chrysophaeum taylorii]
MMMRLARLAPRWRAGRVARPWGAPFSSEAQTVSITFIDQEGKETVVPATVGKTVLSAALASDIDIEAACGGELACSTCHVVLEPENYEKLGEPEEEEMDMLDLAFGLTKTSRLCCQIKVTPDLEGTKYTLPEEPAF